MTKPLFTAFRDSMMANPVGSRKEQMDHFVATMKSDPAYLEKLALDYFERMAASWMVQGEEHDHAFQRTEVSRDKGERISEALTGKPRHAYRLAPRRALSLADSRQQRAESAKRTEEVFADIKAKVRDVVLLDIDIPNGKALRHATGSECKKAGGFYEAIGKAIKPTQVVDRHLTEGDLQNIRARFFQANEESAA